MKYYPIEWLYMASLQVPNSVTCTPQHNTDKIVVVFKLIPGMRDMALSFFTGQLRWLLAPNDVGLSRLMPSDEKRRLLRFYPTRRGFCGKCHRNVPVQRPPMCFCCHCCPQGNRAHDGQQGRPLIANVIREFLLPYRDFRCSGVLQDNALEVGRQLRTADY